MPFKYTNQMHNVYSLHTFIVFLLHVSVSHSPSSGRTYAHTIFSKHVGETQKKHIMNKHCAFD